MSIFLDEETRIRMRDLRNENERLRSENERLTQVSNEQTVQIARLEGELKVYRKHHDTLRGCQGTA